MNPSTVTILGSGAWGSVLSHLVAKTGRRSLLWSRRGDLSLEAALKDADIVVSAISMKGVAELAERVGANGLAPSTILVSATKGLDPASGRTPAQIWQATFPDHPIVVLSGPNLSKEIEMGLPTATVVASLNLEAAAQVQRAFASDRFRVYTNSDPLGTELGGTLKNVIAIAAGVCDGLNLGTNAKAALLTRALAEVIRIGTTLGAQPETFFGLSGLGDLLATCSSALSRNYQVGFALAQGKPLEQILADLQGTAEGVSTTQVLIDLAERRAIPVPVSWQVCQLLSGKITAKQAVEALMERDLKPEARD